VISRRSRLAALAVIVLPAVALASGVEVRYAADRLSVHTGGAVVVRQLFDSITESTGVEFLVDPDLRERRVDVQIALAEFERAMRQIVAAIPGAGGHTTVYAKSATGNVAAARVTVFAAGKAATPTSGAEGAESVEAIAGAPPTPAVTVALPEIPEETYVENERQLVQGGVPEAMAREWIDLTREAVRAQRTPGAAEELMRSERFRRVNRAIAEAQGKFRPSEPEE
jgi:hypothetical protein